MSEIPSILSSGKLIFRYPNSKSINTLAISTRHVLNVHHACAEQ